MFRIGDRVRINSNAPIEYLGIVGTITNILPDPDKYNEHFINHVKFDEPLGTLEGEYFADMELFLELDR